MSGWQEERRDEARRDEVLSVPVLQVHRHGVIDGQDGDVLVCASVGPAGEVVAVWTTLDGAAAVTAATVSAAGASFPDPGAAWPVTARITVHAPDLAAIIQIHDLALAHISVQPMPGGQVLGGRGQVPVAARGPGPQRGTLQRGRAGRLRARARRRPRSRAGHQRRAGLGGVLR
jgi:hypothetical protein